MRATRVLLSAILPLTALAVTTPAHAAPTQESEPNDTVFQVNATANTEGLAGRLATSDDVDFFWIGLRPQRQVQFVASAAGCAAGSSGEVSLWIGPPDSSSSSLVSLRPSNNSTQTASITTPGIYGGPTQYFLVQAYEDYDYWDDSAGCSYSLRVNSASGGTTDAIDPTPPATYPVLQLPEPDDLQSQATGPLVGDTYYQGEISTSNDVDNLWFQQRAGAAVNVQVRVAKGEVSVYDETTEEDIVYGLDGGNYGVHSFPVYSYDRTHRLRITGDEGSAYQVLVTPPSSLGSTPAPPPAAKPTRISLRAEPTTIRRGGIVTLRIKANVSRRLKIKIWQRNAGRGKRWVREGTRRTNRYGAVRHRDDINTGSRYYKACWRKVCSKKVFVRVRR